jgi:hypothetical protein
VADDPIQQAWPSNEDWGKIHAKAWRSPTFRELLEKDPAEAVKQWGLSQTPPKEFDKIVRLRDAPSGGDIPEDFWEDVNPFPPACC